MRRAAPAALALTLSACLAEPFDPGPARPDLGAECPPAVTLLVERCSGCHTAARPPDLSFGSGRLADAYVDAPTPGESLLYRKLTGDLEPGEGGRMPPGAPLSAESIELVRAWIAEGAPVECDALPPPQRHHPEGFGDPAVHGLELKLGKQDCRSCHGSELEGAAGPSCDSCHSTEPGQERAWRTDCTFCHGDRAEGIAAPPRDIDGTTLRELISFRAHREHVSERNHAPYDCSQCHEKPTNVLSPGHIFDDPTPGRAEVRFEGGLSAQGVYLGSGQCSDLYCHGNGRAGSPGALGSYGHDLERPSCTRCHPGASSGRDGWARMSGEHEEHLREGFGCIECHAGTVGADGQTIIGPELHVNGRIDVVFSEPAMTRGPGGCSGTCHEDDHQARSW